MKQKFDIKFMKGFYFIELKKSFKITCAVVVIILSSKVAYAEDSELLFREDLELSAKYFDYLGSQLSKGSRQYDKFSFAKYDLNGDGDNEYIVMRKSHIIDSNEEYNNEFTDIEFNIFGTFKQNPQYLGSVFGSNKDNKLYVSTGDKMKILKSIHDGYHDIAIKCNIGSNKYMISTFDGVVRQYRFGSICKEIKKPRIFSKIISLIKAIYTKNVRLMFKKDRILELKYNDYLGGRWNAQNIPDSKYNDYSFAIYDLNDDGYNEIIVMGKTDIPTGARGYKYRRRHTKFDILNNLNQNLFDIGTINGEWYEDNENNNSITDEIIISKFTHYGYHDIMIKCNINQDKYMSFMFNQMFEGYNLIESTKC